MAGHQPLSSLIPSGSAIRGKFLARVLGIVSEEIVAAWCRSSEATYENLGRPTIRPLGGDGRYTLDFVLRRRDDGRTFVAELKCETEYQGYRYLTLEAPWQLEHHSRPPFKHFLALTRQPDAYTTAVRAKPVSIDGTVLIWGEATAAGKAAVRERYGFSDILTITEMVDDLVRWGDREYQELLAHRHRWCDELWTGLGRETELGEEMMPTAAEMLQHEKEIWSARSGVPPEMILIGGFVEQPKNWARLIDVLAGYKLRYGEWPTAVRLPYLCLQALAEHDLDPEGFQALQRRVDLVVDEEAWTATGPDGHEYRLYSEELPEAVHLAMKAELDIYPPG